MANPYNENCIVLKKTKLGESDLIVTLLSEKGKQIRAVAKGARKPGNKRFGARVEPFSFVSLQLYPGKSLENITELKLIDSHSACREVYEKASSCTLVAEFLDKFSRDGDVGDVVFQLTNSYFAKISKSSAEESLVLTAAYFIKVFAFLGFKPALRECAICSKELDGAQYFDISLGGTLCFDCASKHTITNNQKELIAWLVFLMYSTFDEISEIESCPLKEVMHFIELWMNEHIGLHLKSVTLFKTLF